jgi:hypothetical protein
MATIDLLRFIHLLELTPKEKAALKKTLLDNKRQLFDRQRKLAIANSALEAALNKLKTKKKYAKRKTAKRKR